MFLNRAFEGSMTDVLVAPFQPDGWLLLLVLSVLVSMTFCVMAKITENMRMPNALFQITSVFLSQGIRDEEAMWKSIRR